MTVTDQLPFISAIVLSVSPPSIITLTAAPASASPSKLGLVSLVKSSLFEAPESEEVAKPPDKLAMVSTNILPSSVPTLPAISVAVTL